MFEHPLFIITTNMCLWCSLLWPSPGLYCCLLMAHSIGHPGRSFLPGLWPYDMSDLKASGKVCLPGPSPSLMTRPPGRTGVLLYLSGPETVSIPIPATNRMRHKAHCGPSSSSDWRAEPQQHQALWSATVWQTACAQPLLRVVKIGWPISTFFSQVRMHLRGTLTCNKRLQRVLMWCEVKTCITCIDLGRILKLMFKYRWDSSNFSWNVYHLLGVFPNSALKRKTPLL